MRKRSRPFGTYRLGDCLRVAIIDADLIGRKKHRFPNLACMKLSSYYKSQGDHVELLTSWQVLGYDKIYVSKVFTDTEVPGEVLAMPNVTYGGTGFYYDKAPNLPDEVEHAFPDYHLYDEWVQSKLDAGGKRKDYVYYLDYSIGFLTRGCFRKCEFCVNKKYDRCFPHSPLSEFMDPDRPKLCFLDDNFFACHKWESIIEEVKATGKRFQFKQGLDERLLTDKKIHQMMTWKYDSDFIFAFDNIEDKEIIEEKLKRIYELYPENKKNLKFYVFCGFDRGGGYGEGFWTQDIINTFERTSILRKYNALPYIMRFKAVYGSKYEGMYANISAWCNQPSFFRKMDFRSFCIKRGNASTRYMKLFEKEHPFIASKYFD